MAKFTPALLSRLETFFKENGYTLRYEKGNFKSGSCKLEANNMIVINKFASLDVKIGFLMELLKQITINKNLLSEKSIDLLNQLNQTKLTFAKETE